MLQEGDEGTGNDELDLARREVVYAGVGVTRGPVRDRDISSCLDLLADPLDVEGVTNVDAVVIEWVYEGEW
jgi:hypothetical protein